MTSAVRVAGPAVARAAGPRELVRWLAAPTLVAATAELVLLRLAVRVAIHIPGIEEIAGPYRVVASAGRFAFYAGAVLVAGTLSALYLLLAERGQRGSATAVGAALAALVAARLGLLGDVVLALVTVAATLVLATGAAARDRRLGTATGLFAAASTVAAVHGTVQHLAGTGELRPMSTSELLLAAEILLLAAVGAAARALPRPASSDVAIGIGVAAAALAALSTTPATVEVLMLWTIGLPGYLPAAVYAVVAGVLAALLLAAWRHDRDLTIGLGLLVTGGIGLHNSYQTALVICGLALLAVRARGD